MANGRKTLHIEDFIAQIRNDNCFYYVIKDKHEAFYGKITFNFENGRITFTKREETIK